MAGAAMLLVVGLVGCGSGGGGPGGRPVGAGNPGANGSGGTPSTDTGGPPSGVGGGGPPPFARGGGGGGGGGGNAGGPGNGNAGNGGPPDRPADVVRPGKWVVRAFTGDVIAALGAPCSGQVAYSASSDPGNVVDLTGDGRVKFNLMWVSANPGQAVAQLVLFDPPDGKTTWTQQKLSGTDQNKNLTVSAVFDTPSHLVGTWTLKGNVALGSCPGDLQGRGSWEATPT